MKIKKFNERGFTHIIALLLVVAAIAAVGTYVLGRSSAATANASKSDGTISVTVTYKGKAISAAKELRVNRFASLGTPGCKGKSPYAAKTPIFCPPDKYEVIYYAKGDNVTYYGSKTVRVKASKNLNVKLAIKGHKNPWVPPASKAPQAP